MENPELNLFFALPLPPDVRESLARWQRSQAEIRGWCRPEGLHVTLAFLGRADPDRLPALSSLAERVAQRHRPLELRTATLGGFPRRTAARILWLGLEPCPSLEALALDLRQSLEATREPFDGKPFFPHLTLARFRQPRCLDGVPDPASCFFLSERLVLFESQPAAGYRAVTSWELG